MLFVTRSLQVNEPGEPVVTREMLWDGLVAKAGNALPFVKVMSHCDVIERHSDTVFDREITLHGSQFTERITLEKPHRVVFTRLAGPVLGVITNEIEGAGTDDLALRFSFALAVADAPAGSPAEKDYADTMTQDYLDAVASTLSAVRRIARGETAA
ncbi:SRPBCC family protein [Amycolatopsis pithecellobii]|uniref:DUF1857 family protein n=1 Tax=Amycolatopsis pithecellobii TaxID=664692 RepID=A0A6N7YUZ0_9PSEU|nr:SRPBCC family protein [Amycolatopsis pithecellobii]MTD56885.1 DUF1857 family protein [Amycolatopsis pithecellobii]